MGNSSSTSTSTLTTTERENINQNKLIMQAKKRYKQRLENYSFNLHGDYYAYSTYWESEYELECIPISCRQGTRHNR